MTFALISDVFYDSEGTERLNADLREARAAGAELAVLPELPLDSWFPSTQTRRDQDAEAIGGPRSQTLSAAAKAADIAVVGGAVIRDANDPERRRSMALVFAKSGVLLGTYAKCHLPQEPGYWEASQYDPGDQPPAVFDQFPVPFGLQVCSDAYRPAGTQVLAALGAELVFVPRATETRTYPRWRLVFQANAVTAAVFIASVNRRRPEHGISIGGPSVLVGPTGEVVAESTEPVCVVTIDRSEIRAARDAYPGSLPTRSELYARAWASAAAKRT